MNKKIRKIIVSSSLLIGVIVIPSITLTSCSTISQYYLPVVVNSNPLDGGFVNSGSEFNLIDPYLDHARDINNNSEAIDDNVANYLPTNYLYTSAYDNSFATTLSGLYSYNGYSNNTWNYKNDEGITFPDFPYQTDLGTIRDKRWLNSTDDKFKFVDANNQISSYMNLVNYSASSAVNTTTFNLLTLLNYMNNFQNKIISATDDETINSTLDNVYTHSYSSFNHGSGSETKNLDFYHFCYDNANLISYGDSQFKFGPYDVDWTQTYSGVDTGLSIDSQHINNTSFISLNCVIDLTKDGTGYNKFDVNNDSNKSLSYLVPTNPSFTGTYKWNIDDNDYDWTPAAEMSPYCIYSYGKDDTKHEADPTGVIGIAPIPTLIHINKVTSAFYNPINKSNSINVYDWLTPKNKINDINSAIKNTQAWDNIKKHTGNVEPAIDSVSYTQKFTERKDGRIEYKYDDWFNASFDAKNIDPTIWSWTQTETSDKMMIQPGDFIALAQYNLANVVFTYKDTSGGDVKFKAQIPYFAGYSAVIPAYLVFDLSYYSPIDSIIAQDKQIKILDFSQSSNLYQVWSKLITTLTSNDYPKIDSTVFYTTHDAFLNDPYIIFRWMYGGFNETNNNISFVNSGIIDSDSIIQNNK
ncbi:MAG: hypothetical protein IJP83_00055 [Mycoplasma sp.]|nr:hypothetical protein [Mycoplasma sp.]